MTEPVRFPAHVEISSLIRLAESNNGSAMVLSKGERDGGTILLVTMYRGGSAQLWERMPQMDGTRSFVRTKEQDTENHYEFSDYLSRRREQDPDIWILEVDIADPERFIALLPG
ncbi:DUF1491 family protein [Erythrobacter sp. F6033]|uniref:DUF1491 family protein n=1 Tax=Erythrobacter sp. F6033 TaxID=2926401 RepID=UPI001FF41761|nr:DUF1491 family protein [Erythrobacter sp. F6033]MCK0129735.1 DUF1491 family protein [Erythrobacter sp. F6033]